MSRVTSQRLAVCSYVGCALILATATHADRIDPDLPMAVGFAAAFALEGMVASIGAIIGLAVEGMLEKAQ